MTKPKKPRKPKPYIPLGLHTPRAGVGKKFVWTDMEVLCDALDCRRLAAWLTRAADYLEAKEKET